MTNGVESGDDEPPSKEAAVSEAPVSGDDEPPSKEAAVSEAPVSGGDEEARAAHPGDYDPLRAVVAAARQYAAVGLPLLAVAAMLVAGKLYGPSAGVLVLAGAALATAIGTFWTSVRALAGETALSSEDAFALGAPSAEEEQKRAVLRAIKDIEFERSVGKLAEEDFAELYARYRAEAKRLLRRIDEGARPQRDRVEALVRRRLAEEGTGKEEAGADETGKDGTGKDGTGKDGTGKDGTGKDGTRRGAGKSKAAGHARPRCGACGAKNDDDARFCKGCGKSMPAKEAT